MSVAPNVGIVEFGVFKAPDAGLDGVQGQVPGPTVAEAGYVLSTTGWVPGGGGGGGSGTVTSVNVNGGTTGLTTSGGPITTSGTITISGTLAVANGGTGANNATTARTNLGLGTIATQNAASVAITGGSITGITDLAVADGGTGASDAATARTNLGATTVGGNLFTLANPSAITFVRLNSDNSISTLNASDFRTAIGAGTGSGSVTSVGLSLPSFFTVSGSPVTNSGTLTAVMASQTANTLLAAPDGTAGAPTFRALTSTDIPNLDASKITSGTLNSARLPSTADTNARVAVENNGTLVGTRRTLNFIPGSNVTLTITDDSANEEVDITIASTGGGGGGVSSVDVSGGSTGLSFSGGPITSSGTITMAGTLDLDNGGTGSTTAAGARTNLDAQKTITSGTAAPSGGSDGDIYLQYV
jgi:hypothetical protein